ncbi:MAG: class I tRNA ligase family protein, partial [Ilumatobacteraceae bacterium]
MPPFRPVDPNQSFPEMEVRVGERWKRDEVFRRSQEMREGAEVWSFYEGPPTANGRPGSHHVLSRVFKDIYPRYPTMKCRESVFTYVEEWNRLTERIGFWIDLDDPYVTLDDDYIESVWWSLRQLFDQGRLYEGHRVSPYCPRCGTALSSHEVALGYRDVTDRSVYVRLGLLDEAGQPPGESLLVWTTTPWTL